MRVRLRSNCIEPRRLTIGKISLRGRQCCGSSCDRRLTVTADPSEGEALTDAGNDLVATVPMPVSIIESIDGFIAEHHVERPFQKRQRDRGEPQNPAHRGADKGNRK